MGMLHKNGSSLKEKQSFYDELRCEWYIISVGDLVMCLDDFKRHVGRHIDGYVGGYGVWQRNLKGRSY